MSLGFESKQSPLWMQGLSLGVGVAVCEVLREACSLDCGLKWPNDVLVSGGKLCGILIEHQQRGQNHQYVAGIGVNLCLSAEEMSSVNQPVRNLFDCGIEINRTDLVVRLINAVMNAIEAFEGVGFRGFAERYQHCDSLAGKEVEVLLNDGRHISGFASGVDSGGALLVRTAAGMQRFIGGEVSVKVS